MRRPVPNRAAVPPHLPGQETCRAGSGAPTRLCSLWCLLTSGRRLYLELTGTRDEPARSVPLEPHRGHACCPAQAVLPALASCVSPTAACRFASHACFEHCLRVLGEALAALRVWGVPGPLREERLP